MNEIVQAAANAMQAQYGAEMSEFRGEVTLVIAVDKIIDALKALHDSYQFSVLIDLTAVDYFPNESPRFHVVYELSTRDNTQRLRLRAPVEGNQPAIPTSEKIFPNANWYEREVWDLMGITFEGHSDLRRIVMPYEWSGHPLRKDYPLGYEEPQFTFNYDEIMVKKPQPKD